MAPDKKHNILYLEHYLRSLQNLPAELQSNFLTMRELDTRNKSILQEIDIASDEYLRRIIDLSPESRKKEMDNIQSMFTQAKQYGDEKVSIAIQTYEMVDKHIRRLDADLAKFEAELREKGQISQTDEESEVESINVSKNKARSNKKKMLDEDDFSDYASNKSHQRNKNDKVKNRNKNKSSGDSKLRADKKNDTVNSRSTTSDSRKSVGNNSKKIAPKNDISLHKKEASSSLSSNPKSPAHEFDMNRACTGDQALLPASAAAALLSVPQEVLDMPVDPNEPTYCVCQQVSYGEMVGCDNPDCPIEWFHFGCMNLTTKPKGKWFCPKCLPLVKKKR